METLSKDHSAESQGEATMLGHLNRSLHELSQPITVLLCALEYGGSVGSIVEMRKMIKVSQEACVRLREITAEMREIVRDAMHERSTNGASIGSNR